MTVTWPGWCSLEIPEGWTYEDRLDLVSIFREEDGVGALQLSFARRERPEPPTSDTAIALAQAYAVQRGWRVLDKAMRVIVVDGCPCVEFDHVQANGENTYWQVWHILDHSRLAFVTYVCEPEDARVEQSERHAIVESFRWI